MLYPPEVDYLDILMDCEFLERDIDQFVPKDRFITGGALIERWSNVPGIRALQFIQKNIRDGRLHDLDPEWAHGKESFPAVEEPAPEGMFLLSEIEEIEKVDFGPMNEWEPQTSPAPGSAKPAVYGDERQPSADIGSPLSRTQQALAAANARHDQPGGSRDKQAQIREIWATGKYLSRDRCAEEECAALDMSFAAARKALRNTPAP